MYNEDHLSVYPYNSDTLFIQGLRKLLKQEHGNPSNDEGFREFKKIHLLRPSAYISSIIDKNKLPIDASLIGTMTNEVWDKVRAVVLTNSRDDKLLNRQADQRQYALKHTKDWFDDLARNTLNAYLIVKFTTKPNDRITTITRLLMEVNAHYIDHYLKTLRLNSLEEHNIRTCFWEKVEIQLETPKEKLSESFCLYFTQWSKIVIKNEKRNGAQTESIHLKKTKIIHLGGESLPEVGYELTWASNNDFDNLLTLKLAFCLLEGTQKVCIYKRFFSESKVQTYDSIANELNITWDEVRSSIQSGHKRLKTSIKKMYQGPWDLTFDTTEYLESLKLCDIPVHAQWQEELFLMESAVSLLNKKERASFQLAILYQQALLESAIKKYKMMIEGYRSLSGISFNDEGWLS